MSYAVVEQQHCICHYFSCLLSAVECCSISEVRKVSPNVLYEPAMLKLISNFNIAKPLMPAYV